MPTLLQWSETFGCGATIKLGNGDVVHVSIGLSRVTVRQWDLRSLMSALACRRSTAALAAANERRSSAPDTRFLGLATQRWALPVPRRPSPASSSQTGRHAGRAYGPEPPGSELTRSARGNRARPASRRHRLASFDSSEMRKCT